MVYGTWYMVYGIWYMVWYMVYGMWYMVYVSWFMRFGFHVLDLLFRFWRASQPVRETRGRNVKRFQGGLVFKAHRLLYHSTLGLRVIKKKNKIRGAGNL